MENERYRIRYTPLSYEDLDEIDSYITDTLCNPSAAEKLLDKMEYSINQLRQFPFLGAMADDTYLVAKGYRRIAVDNYLVFYLVHEEKKEVVIMRVLYGAREYHNLL